jgi:hypothetical protein
MREASKVQVQGLLGDITTATKRFCVFPSHFSPGGFGTGPPAGTKWTGPVRGRASMGAVGPLHADAGGGSGTGAATPLPALTVRSVSVSHLRIHGH